jgi:O-antigen ligase
VIKNIFYKSRRVFTSKNYQVLFISLLYYLSLYFSTNNRTLLTLTLVYWFLIYRSIKNFTMSTLIVFIATLSFPKGKAYEFLLLSKENIPHWALYDIKYFFPVYLSDLFLVILIYLYTRNHFFKKTKYYLKKSATFLFTNILPYTFFILFIIWVILWGSLSLFPEVGILSSIQLIRMLFIFGLPIITSELFGKTLKDKTLKGIFGVIIALLLFESGWTLLQKVNGGPLGRDIEVYLPGAKYGILSSENKDLLRNNGTFFEPSILGTFLIMQITVLLPLIIYKRKVTYFRIPALLSIIGATTALVFTGSRVLYSLLMGIYLIVFLTLFKQKRININKIKRFLNYKTITILIFFITLLSPYLLNRVSSLTDVFTKYGSATYRIQMIIYSLRIFQEHFLTGIGVNLSPYFLASGFSGEKYPFDPTYPHNLTIQLLAETGIIGTFLFILFLINVLKPYFTKNTLSIIPGFALAAGVYFLCSQFYPIFLNHPELSSFFFLYAGLSPFAENHKRKHGEFHQI